MPCEGAILPTLLALDPMLRLRGVVGELMGGAVGLTAGSGETERGLAEPGGADAGRFVERMITLDNEVSALESLHKHRTDVR